jgi:hypothetical protein
MIPKNLLQLYSNGKVLFMKQKGFTFIMKKIIKNGIVQKKEKL